MSTCVVDGTLSLVLFVMRAFGLAPLKFARERQGYRISVCYTYAVIGWISFACLCLSIAFGIHYDLVPGEVYNNPTDQTLRSTFLWILNTIALLTNTVYASVYSLRTMKDMIEHLKNLDTIAEKVGTQRKSEKMSLIVSVVLFLSRCFIDIVRVTHNVLHFGGFNRNILMYCLINSNCIMIVLLHLQTYALYMEVLPVFEGIRGNLERVAKTKRIVSDSTTHITNVCKRIKNVTNSFTLLHLAVTKMHKSNEMLVTLIYGCIAYRLTYCAYICSKSFFDDNTEDTNFTNYALLINNILSMMLIVEPFVRIDKEIQHMKVVLGHFMTSSEINETVFSALETLSMEMCECDFSYSPLGLITVRRTLVAQTLGVMITYLLIIVQF